MKDNMTKDAFFKKYGGMLVTINPEDSEFGEHLILYPEETQVASDLLSKGKDIYTVYEESADGEGETVAKGFDSGAYVVGYYAVHSPDDVMKAI